MTHTFEILVTFGSPDQKFKNRISTVLTCKQPAATVSRFLYKVVREFDTLNLGFY